MPIKAMQDSAERGPFDELYTPSEAVSYLLPYLPRGVIWEPCPGDGILAGHLRAAGYQVIAEDRDFFEWRPEDGWDAIVTNPPFSIKAKILHRCNELGRPWAVLLPVTALGARNCQVELEGCQVIFLPRRIDFTGKKAPWFAVAWFTRGLNLPYPLTFVNDGDLAGGQLQVTITKERNSNE